MEPYPVDIDPAQVVRWLIAEHRVTPSSLKTTARRTTEVREIPARGDLHLGDEEREDLSEVANVVTLEIAPARPADGWLLTVVAEDELGPHGPDRGTMVEDAQQIDLTASSSAQDGELRPSSRRQTMPRPRPVSLVCSHPSKATGTVPVLASKDWK
jgi:hypothetical protein